MLILAAILAIFVYGMIAAMLGTILPDLSARFQLTPKQNGTIASMQALGLIIALCSFAYAIRIVIAGLSGEIDVSGFATIVTINAFLGGCTLFMLGIIGEYLWRTFDQVSGRPEAVVAEEHL